MAEKREKKGPFGELVVIASLPRSGGSWLGEIIDTNPDVLYKYEPFYENFSLFSGLPEMIKTNEGDSGAERVLVEGLKTLVYTNHWRLDKRKRENYLEKRYAVPKKLLKIARHLPLLNDWLFRMALESRNIRLVIKTIRSGHRLGWMDRILRHPKIIYIIRHPCGFVNSYKGGAKYKFEFKSVEAAAERWLKECEAVLQCCREMPNSKLVVFEELCQEPERVVQEIFDFLGWELRENTKEFIKESTAKELPGYYDIYKEPLKSAFKWEKELSKKEIDTVNGIVGKSDLMRLWKN